MYIGSRIQNYVQYHVGLYQIFVSKTPDAQHGNTPEILKGQPRTLLVPLIGDIWSLIVVYLGPNRGQEEGLGMYTSGFLKNSKKHSCA